MELLQQLCEDLLDVLCEYLSFIDISKLYVNLRKNLPYKYLLRFEMNIKLSESNVYCHVCRDVMYKIKYYIEYPRAKDTVLCQGCLNFTCCWDMAQNSILLCRTCVTEQGKKYCQICRNLYKKGEHSLCH
jgi:hypothetical protein